METPPAPTNRSSYVVVCGGETVTVPAATGETAPTPLLIDALVALVLAQVSVAVCPCEIVVGVATRDPVGGGISGGVAATDTVTESVEIPPGPRSNSVNVVEVVTRSEADPDSGSIPYTECSTVVAYCVDQLKVTLPPPAPSEEGVAENDPIGSGYPVPPPGPASRVGVSTGVSVCRLAATYFRRYPSDTASVSTLGSPSRLIRCP